MIDSYCEFTFKLYFSSESLESLNLKLDLRTVRCILWGKHIHLRAGNMVPYLSFLINFPRKYVNRAYFTLVFKVLTVNKSIK